jgi:hypothetical protein
VTGITWPNEVQRAVSSGLDVEVEIKMEVRQASGASYASSYEVIRWRSYTNRATGSWNNVVRNNSPIRLPAY